MTPNNSKNYDYYFGGSLPVESDTYVKRQADDRLFQKLLDANFSYVLNSRQMGKSSLMVRTKQRLEKNGVACAAIDLTDIGSQNITVIQWYRGVVKQIVNGLELEIDWKSWWNQRRDEEISPVQMFGDFIREALLPQVASRRRHAVIFVDEIDSIINLPFPTDDFFALVRACHNKRAEFPLYKCLTFCLLGVATPSDLIADKTRTPFNIGTGIELTGFTFAEAKDALTPGLAVKVDRPEAVLREVLDWTGGQPFLTQKLCNLIVNNAESFNPDIARLVRSYVINNWEGQDNPEHLRTIRNRIFSKDRGTGRLLKLYKKILLHKKIKVNKSSEQIDLRLSGLVVTRQGTLIVYNRIYESVFNDNWVSQELEKRSTKQTKIEIIQLENELDRLKQKLKICEAKKYHNAYFLIKIYCFLFFILSIFSPYMLLPNIKNFWQDFAVPNLANFLNKRGTQNYNESNYETAEFFYRLALTIDSDFNKARYALGSVCERREDFDCAKQEYKLAMEDKNIRLAVRATNNLARLHIFQQQDYQTAIALASFALKKAESPAIETKVRSDLYKNLGWAHFLENRYLEAEKNLREAIAIEEDNTSAYCLLAQVLEGQEKEAEALVQWRECLNYPTPRQNPEVRTWKNMARQRLK